MKFPTLADIVEIKGKKVLVRLDFNVPIQDGKVVDSFRITQAMPTIKYLKDKGAKVIIIGHIEGESDTFEPVYEYLKTQMPISFCQDCLEKGGEQISAMQDGDVVLCENLRLYDGEKKNDEAFAKQLASLGEIYVNDAFSVSHRKHASVVGVPKFLPGFIGLQFEKEIEHLSKAFNPPHPFLFILGGAKFDTKLPLIEKFMPLADNLFIAGALANDLFKAKGFNVGTSLVSETAIDFSPLITNPKLLLPTDVTVRKGSDQSVKAATEVADDEFIADVGPQTLEMLAPYIKNAKCILWNGPLGNYEKGYKQPTLELAKMIGDSDALSLVGGGDTLAAIAELGIDEKFSFISTGGGAMLDFLAKGTLPGLDALKKKIKHPL